MSQAKKGPGPRSNQYGRLGMERLLPALTSGGCNAIIIISVEISFAAMIFSGPNSSFVSRGIGILLLGTFLVGLITTLKSSHPNAVALVQDVPVAILAAPLAGIGAAMGPAAQAGGDALFYTLVFSMAASSMVVGLLMLVMAWFKLGNLVRFVPYPVIGGFLAGIGWLLFKGGIEVMSQASADLNVLGGLFTQAVMVKWLPGLAFALLLFWMLRNFSHFLILPGMVLAGVLLFFLGLKLTGTPFARAEALGWFLGPFPQGALWKPIPFDAIAQVRWNQVLSMALPMVTIFIIASISLLLNASGLELSSGRDMDLNQEMKTAGLANILISFIGSPSGYMTMALSALSHKLSPGDRLSGIFLSAMLGIALIFGPSIVSVFPRPLAGAMLVLIGIDMMWDWAWASRTRLPRSDYAMILIILVVIAGMGFLQGVGAGIVIAVILFVVNYSRISIIGGLTSGRHFQSNVERSVPQRWILDRQGDQILICKLQGFIFFGTANQLRGRLEDKISDPDMPEIRFLVFDFSKVSGCDSSAMNSFERICQFAEPRGITLVFVSVLPDVELRFRTAGLQGKEIRFLPDLDQGMEWCENRILEAAASSGRKDQVLDATFDQMVLALDQMEAFESLVQDLRPYVDTRPIVPGTPLFRDDSSEAGICLIEFGQVSLLLEIGDRIPLRLQIMGKGSMIGEALSRRGVSVVGSAEGRALFLSEAELARLEKEAPELAAKLFKLMAQGLSDRLSRSHALIRELS